MFFSKLETDYLKKLVAMSHCVILSCTNSSPLLLTTAVASNKVNKVNWATTAMPTTRTVMLTAAEPASCSQLDIDLSKSQPMLLFHHQKKPDIPQALLKGVI